MPSAGQTFTGKKTAVLVIYWSFNCEYSCLKTDTKQYISCVWLNNPKLFLWSCTCVSSIDIFRLCTGIYIHVESEESCSTTVIVQAAVQLILSLFFSATSSICIILLSMISLLLASLRSRSWALSSSKSSKNLCLHGKRNHIYYID